MQNGTVDVMCIYKRRPCQQEGKPWTLAHGLYQRNSKQCCRTNINNDKRGYKQNKHSICTHYNSFASDTVVIPKYNW